MEDTPPEFDYTVADVFGTYGDERQNGDAPWALNTRHVVEVGDRFKGRIADPIRGDIDRDLIRVELTANSAYWIWVTGDEDSSTPLKDPELVIYDRNGNYLTHDDDELFPYDAATPFLPETTGTYYIGVHTSFDARDPNGSGDYEIGVFDFSFTGEDEQRNDINPSRPVSLSVGDEYVASIRNATDKDAFRFYLEEGKVYEFFARGVFNGEVDEFQAHMRGPNGQLIDLSEGSGNFKSTEGDGPDVAFEVAPKASGHYVLEIESDENDVGYYEVNCRIL